MIKYVEFRGFTDTGVKDFGRILLEDGKLRAEGGMFMENLLNGRVRDPRPKRSHKWLTKDDGELFLKALPYYFCGTRLCASRVQVGRRKSCRSTFT